MGFAAQLDVVAATGDSELSALGWITGSSRIRFAHDAQAGRRRVWVNAEWSLRYYLEWEGARAVRRDQNHSTGRSYWSG